ncbi:MAG: enoyl-CoA hydratase/isomerase family protein [Planctomycetota bacterium]
MSYETLQLDRDGPVLRIRLNRPEVRNAFNGTVVEELASAFGEASNDQGLRAVVLSGNGKSFCAGADLAWMKDEASRPREENERGAARMARMFLSIARCAKPVIARVHGHALGGGAGLTAAADIAFCARDAVFGLTEVRLGIVPAVISPFVMQKIGAGRARALFVTGERFDGAEAERIGLVHRAVAASELDAEVDRALSGLLAAGPAAVANAKELIRAVEPLSLEDAVPLAAKWIADLRATPEAREGMDAFLNRRKPNWSLS